MPVRQQDHGRVECRALSRGLEQAEHLLGRANDHSTVLSTEDSDFLNGHGNYGKVCRAFLPWILGNRIAGRSSFGG